MWTNEINKYHSHNFDRNECRADQACPSLKWAIAFAPRVGAVAVIIKS